MGDVGHGHDGADMPKGVVDRFPAHASGDLRPVFFQEPQQFTGLVESPPAVGRAGSRPGVGQRPERAVQDARPFGRDDGQQFAQDGKGVRAPLRVDSGETYDAFRGRRAIVCAHPLHDGEHLVGPPGPETEAGECVRGISGAVHDVIADRPRGGGAGFHGQGGETHFTDEEPK